MRSREPSREERSRELQHSGERSDASYQHDTEADGHAQRQSIEGGFQIDLGDQLGHDEVPRGLGVSFGLIARHAAIPEMLRVTQGIKRKDHSHPPTRAILYLTDPTAHDTLAAQ